jgi:hypothetical protein
VALLLASFLDPIKLVIFGGLGAFAAHVPALFASGSRATRATAFIVSVVIGLGVGYVLPNVYDAIRFSPNVSSPHEPGYNPFDDEQVRRYIADHANLFVASNSRRQSAVIISQIEEAKRDCRALVGGPEYSLGERCRLERQFFTIVAGGLQFALGAAGVVFWKRRRLRPT